MSVFDINFFDKKSDSNLGAKNDKNSEIQKKIIKFS